MHDLILWHLRLDICSCSFFSWSIRHPCLQVAANPLRVRVKHLVNKPFNARDDVLVASTMEVVSTLKDLLTLHPLYNEHLKVFANAGGDLNTPGKIADMAASITSADQTALQGILEELDVVQR